VAKEEKALGEGVEVVTSGTFGDMTHISTRTMPNVEGLDGNGCRALTRSGTHV